MEAGDRNPAREIEGGVSIAPFDCSAENFFAAMKSISELCGETGEESFEDSELHRFSSMITFLKEWKQFCYEPKIINFAYETGSGDVKSAINGINLSQFASAIVPKMEQLPDRTRFLSSNDFVLHSGGAVWALDWCPRIHEKPNRDIKCEYLAIAAHSPGSSYHKIGAPLVGRGIVQIWCLLNVEEKGELSLSRPGVRGRPRKNKLKAGPPYNLKAESMSTPTKPRGRPRKGLVANESLCTSDAEQESNLEGSLGRPTKIPKKNLGDKSGKEISTSRPRGRPGKKQSLGLCGVQQLSLKRPRGRPRNKLTVNVNGKEELPQSNNDLMLSLNECISPLSIEFGEVVPVRADLKEEESSLPRRRGRPRKKPIPAVNRSVQSGIESHQGNDDLTLSLHENILPLSIEFGEVAPISANLNEAESVAPRCRGRPRKKPIASLDASVQSGVESPQFNNNITKSLNEYASPLSIEFGELAPVSADLNEGESVMPRHRGRPRKKAVPNAKNDARMSGVFSPQTINDLTLSLNECVSSLNIDSGEVQPVSADLSEEESVVRRRRGRPRKKPIPSISKDVQISGVESPQTNYDVPLSVNELVSPFSIESVELSLVSTNLNEEEPGVPRHRGRPRKKPIPSLDKDVQISYVESAQTNNDLTLSINEHVSPLSIEPGEVAPVATSLDEKESVVARRRGRPRKKPVPNANTEAQVSGIEIPGSDNNPSLNECISTLSIEIGEVEPVSANLVEEKSFAPRSRGRPRKKPIPSVHKSVPTSAVELEEVSLDLPVSALLNKAKSFFQRCRGRPRKKPDSAILLSNQTDEGLEVENCGGYHNGWSAVGSDSTACTPKRRIKDQVGLVTGANSVNPVLSTVNEHEEFSAIDVSAQDNYRQDEKLLSREVSRKRLLEAGMASSLVSDEFALPRVVLCLAHNGKVVWDVKWSPPDVNDSEGKHHMGYLAVLLGNGSLEVWEVPRPSMVKSLYTTCCGEGTDPRFVKLEPIFKCSKVKCGDRQSIPLTVEWSSPSASQCLILAGCHDGTVVLWKFSPQVSSQDTKPLLCFAADTAPIRAVAWAPEGSDAESANLIATAGHEGLKFWDLRDPYHPLWHLNPQSAVLSVDWLKDPGCVIISLDDGTVRTLSMWQSAMSAPFTGEPISLGKKLGLHSKCCLPFAIWSVHVSRTTGLAAYCGADGSAILFQVTTRYVDRPRKRNEVPHILCGSITAEGPNLKIKTLLDNDPSVMNELEETSQSITADASDKNKAQEPKLPVPDDRIMLLESGNSHSPKELHFCNQVREKTGLSQAREAEVKPLQNSGCGDERKPSVDAFPPKIAALHRVRWNMNKGCERWLCYGGAAGIVRCQKIVLTNG